MKRIATLATILVVGIAGTANAAPAHPRKVTGKAEVTAKQVHRFISMSRAPFRTR